MDLLDGSPSLRQELQRIVELGIDEQRVAVESISETHSVRFAASAANSLEGTCFGFAFDLLNELHSDPLLKRLATPDTLLAFGLDVFPDGCFVRWLWVNGYVVSGNGEIWLYFDGSGRPRHAARSP